MGSKFGAAVLAAAKALPGKATTLRADPRYRLPAADNILPNYSPPADLWRIKDEGEREREALRHFAQHQAEVSRMMGQDPIAVFGLRFERGSIAGSPDDLAVIDKLGNMKLVEYRKEEDVD